MVTILLEVILLFLDWIPEVHGFSFWFADVIATGIVATLCAGFSIFMFFFIGAMLASERLAFIKQEKLELRKDVYDEETKDWAEREKILEEEHQKERSSWENETKKEIWAKFHKNDPIFLKEFFLQNRKILDEVVTQGRLVM
ncbi:MAG: hypothetical protein M3P22_02250 [bacterium]|nr:hypothetical protein [bacterium]